MKGKLTICALEVPCRLGIEEHERAEPQTVRINMELEFEFPSKDELDATVDYAVLASQVKKFCAERTWKLIETMAVDLTDFVLRATGVGKVTVEVMKTALPDASFVSAKVTRQPESKA